MSIAAYIKEIGRGKDGARPLSTEQAHDLLSQVLDKRVSDLEIGAFALAMRIKGETAAELVGFVQAAHERCLQLPLPATSGVVVLPSYNGARKLPNLTALLAAYLARMGLCVLVHGPLQDPTRVTTAQVFEALKWPLAQDATGVSTAWAAGMPAFMPIEVLCPALAQLLAVRWTIGLRNPGHTVAKLLSPWPMGTAVAQVINHTHPEYATSLADYLQSAPHTRALLMRGTEGEPVADARRQPRLEAYAHGQRQADLCLAPTEGVLTELPHLPQAHDAQTTARYIEAVLGGQQEMPQPIKMQAETLAALLKT
jgi:anthranilate phosphoribosyltransferase